MTEACCRCTLQYIQSGSANMFVALVFERRFSAPPRMFRFSPLRAHYGFCPSHFMWPNICCSSLCSMASTFHSLLIFMPLQSPPSYPGSLLSLQSLHDQHGVHILVVLLLVIVVALFWLLQPFLELPLEHQFPEAVAFLCCSLRLCLQKNVLRTSPEVAPFTKQVTSFPDMNIPQNWNEGVPTCSSWISLSRRSTMWSCCCFSAFSRASRFQGSGDRLSLDVSSSLLMVMYCRSRLSMVRGCCCGSSSLITVSMPKVHQIIV